MYIKSQTFYIDPNSVNNAASVFLTSVDIYVNTKPAATNNASGLSNPGIRVTISDTDSVGAPIFGSTYPQSNVFLPYANITADPTGATSATTFTFSQPIPVTTGKRYSINVQADDDAYTLWYAKKDDAVLGTSSSPFPGFSGGYQGQLFDYGNSGNITPIQNTQLKYTVRIAQFTANTATYEIVNNGFEFFFTTGQKGTFLGGEIVYPLYANLSGTVAFTTGSTVITGTGTSFLSTFVNNAYIVVYSNTSVTFARKISNIANNTSLTVSEAIPYTSNASTTFFKAPTGNVYNFDQSSNTLILTNSNANSSTYFANSSLFTATLTNGSNQYTSVSSTTNLFVGQPVWANVSGVQPGTTITAIGTTTVNVSTNWSNAGVTGSSVAATNVYASTPIVGGVSGANAYIGSIFVWPINQFEPEIGINVPPGGNASLTYSFASANSSVGFYMPAFLGVTNNTKKAITEYNAYILSRSIEQNQATSYLYGSAYGLNKSGVIKTTLTQDSNTGNIYTSPYIFAEKLDIFAGITTINNDATNENTNYGNAAAKHITQKISFDPTYSAQDLLVQAIAYVPAGTQLLAYAKLYNSKDSDIFTTKQWTALIPAVGNTVSNTTAVSTAQSNTYVQLSWGIPNQPLVAYTANGTVSVASSSTTGSVVTGSNTNFGTEILVNDVVRIWNPLSPAVYAVAVVNSIASNVSLTLNTPISNTSITQPGFQIDKVSNPYQAFTNPQNYNVVRYYNSTLTEFDTYDTMQVKMVMLSNSSSTTPRIASLTAVGLSS
jgi:hypothetical protein